MDPELTLKPAYISYTFLGRSEPTPNRCGDGTLARLMEDAAHRLGLCLQPHRHLDNQNRRGAEPRRPISAPAA